VEEFEKGQCKNHNGKARFQRCLTIAIASISTAVSFAFVAEICVTVTCIAHTGVRLYLAFRLCAPNFTLLVGTQGFSGAAC